MNKDCTILFCTCDSYADLWDPFFTLLKNYWPECSNNKILINTESMDYSFDGLNIKCLQLYSENDKVPYGERMIQHIKAIDTEFTMVMIDDFFLTHKVDDKALDEVIQWMKNDERTSVFHFYPVRDKDDVPSEKYPKYDIRPLHAQYKFCFQAGIWKTDYLLKAWKPHENPWEWEHMGNMRSNDPDRDFYVIRNEEEAPIRYCYSFDGSAVYHGKWNVDLVEPLFKENGIEVDFSIRGEYDPNNDITKPRMKNNSRSGYESSHFKSLGLKAYLSYTCWRITRAIKLKLGKPVDKNFIVYRRRKNKK